MEIIIFPSNTLDLTLQKQYPFIYEKYHYNSVIDFICENRKGHKNKQKSVECDENNRIKAEKCLTEMLKQNEKIRNQLLATNDKQLAYAMIADNDWGIRLSPKDSMARLKKNWKGNNYLGEILMSVRQYLFANPQSYADVNLKFMIKEQPLIGWQEYLKIHEKEKFTFFWRAESPFSQHHLTNFELEGHIFNCSEQYYMYMKAEIFNDSNSKYKILNTDNPAKQKSLGRKVVNFDLNKWNTYAENIVYKANVAKFEQNSRLLKLLLMTEGTTLVEASPMDLNWGVGLEASDARIFMKETWCGTNLLGTILGRVREHFITNNIQSDYVFSYLSPDCYLSFSKNSSPFHYLHMVMFEVDSVKYSSLNHYLVKMAASFSGDVNVLKMIDSTMDNSKIDSYFGRITNLSKYYDKLRNLLMIGNYYKFTQNNNLLGQLLDTAGCVLVFIDSEHYLGTGDSHLEDSEILCDNWRGQNLLGYSLTYLRDKYIKSNGRYQPESDFNINDYKGIKAVSFSNSQNNKKREAAISYQPPQISFQSLDNNSNESINNNHKNGRIHGKNNYNDNENSNWIWSNTTFKSDDNLHRTNFEFQNSNITSNHILSNLNNSSSTETFNISSNVTPSVEDCELSIKSTDSENIIMNSENCRVDQLNLDALQSKSVEFLDSSDNQLKITTLEQEIESNNNLCKKIKINNNYIKQIDQDHATDNEIKDDNSVEKELIQQNSSLNIDLKNHVITFDMHSSLSPTSDYQIKIEGINFPTVNHYIYWKQADIYQIPQKKKEILNFKKSQFLYKFDKDFKYDGKFDLDKWQNSAERILMDANLIKFKSNNELMEELVSTKDFELKYSNIDDIVGTGKDSKKKKVPTATLR